MTADDAVVVTFEVTGCAARTRIAPLLPEDWLEHQGKKENQEGYNSTTTKAVPHFLWENAPRRDTKEYRDYVKCYSHLPNGLAVLDSKWALARLFAAPEGAAATLDSHCFRGSAGFGRFCDKVGMFRVNEEKEEDASPQQRLPDIFDDDDNEQVGSYPPAPRNIWVVKDDMSNGAGGIWMVSPDNAAKFLATSNSSSSPLVEEHRYVAQQYTWPPVLFQGKKCHVRVYGLMTADGRAFVHSKCFLHVANETFQSTSFEEDSVHITNCCANSHDKTKFAGEICADLSLQDFGTTTDCGQPIIPLGKFFDSIAASVALLGKRSFPFLKGGDLNNGLEYLGMDFILSYRDDDGAPVAYLLEVNAPPSQDTATGLPHAEQLHDEVLSDLINLWVLPSTTGVAEKLGGWKCVYRQENETSSSILPSKAVILNKIRWAIFERKTCKAEETQLVLPSPTTMSAARVARFARSQFPYFAERSPIFMENAGGAQVPYAVVDAMTASLSRRHRSVIGAEQKTRAQHVAKLLLGCRCEQGGVHFGSNATSLLRALADKFVSVLEPGDEIIVATENHEANTNPWLAIAQQTGATIKWWSSVNKDASIDSLLTPRTKIVAVSHASNLLGQARDLVEIGNTVRNKCPEAQVVVDGVAAVPHIYANLKELPIDWYAVSCHKLFGPHLGILCGPSFDATLEVGTINYEACAGLVGLGDYFGQLATFTSQGEQAASQSTHADKDRREGHSTALDLTEEHIVEAYRRIGIAEKTLAAHLKNRLQQSSTKIVILESQALPMTHRLPTVAFHHNDISSATIVEELSKQKVACRQGAFLCTTQLQEELGWKGNVTRLSLAHYNTVDEIDFVIGHLEDLQGWV